MALEVIAKSMGKLERERLTLLGNDWYSAAGKLFLAEKFECVSHHLGRAYKLYSLAGNEEQLQKVIEMQQKVALCMPYINEQ